MPEENNLSNLKTLIVSIPVSQSNHDHAYQRVGSNSNKLNGDTDVDEILVSGVNKRKISKKKWKLEHQHQINASERERKGRLAANIKKLKEVIPLQPIKLQTKETVLEEALKYIFQLKSQVEQMLLKDAPENLVSEIDQLRKKVSKLESEKKFFLQILQSHGLLHKSQVNVMPLPKVCVSEKQLGLQTSSSEVAISTTSNSTINPRTVENQARSSSAAVVSKTSTSCSSSSSSNDTVSTTVVSQLTPLLTSNADLGVSNVIETSAGVSSDVSSSLSVSLSLPQQDLLFRHPNTAVCSPTYSMARMKSDSSSKAPTLRTMLTETFRNNQQKSVSAVNATSSSSSTSSLMSTSDLGTKTSSILSLGSISVSNTTGDTAKQSSGANLHSQSANTVLSSNSMSSNSSSSLVSWLRGSNSQSSTCSTSSVVVVAQSNSTPQTASTFQNLETKVPDLMKDSALNTTSASKKETHSFNIASLMRSKDAISENRFSPCTSDSPSATIISKDCQIVSEPNSVDFNDTSSKDVFHQSFETDFFECLQNLQALSTPEPPTKNMVVTTCLVTPVASEWSNIENHDNVGRTVADLQPRTSIHLQQNISSTSTASIRTSTVNDHSLYGLRYNRQGQTVEGFATGQYEEVVSVAMNKSRPAISYTLLSSNAYNGMASSTSVLWQPAIAPTPLRYVVSTASSCFSPISYFSGNNFHASQPCSSIDNNPTWITSSCPSGFISAPSRIPSESNQNVSNFNHPKKRKLPQTGNKSASKRKKSSNKHDQEQEDTHSISRLIGFQHSAVPPPLALCDQSPRFMNPTPNISFESDRLASNPAHIFTNSPGAAGLVPSGVPYNSYPPQANLFRSASAVNSQKNTYHHPASGYFYNHPMGSHHQQHPSSMYVPRFANTNNSNSTSNKHHKGSQHHIRQILS